MANRLRTIYGRPEFRRSKDTAVDLDSRAARIAAGFVSLVAWAGLAVQFAATLEQTGSLSRSLWTIMLYFTVLTNAVVAAVMTGIALGFRAFRSASLLGGSTLAIILVGVTYSLLLHGLLHLSGGAKLANVIMHYVVPILVPLYWLVYSPKGKLRMRDPLLWSLFPLAYLPYALIRGASANKYPYPFIDVAKLGWSAMLLNAAAIAIGFLVTGFAMLALDKWLGRRSAPPIADPSIKPAVPEP